MGFVIVGLLLVLLKALDVAPVTLWSWGWVLAPFALAVAWWRWSDASGRTKRNAMKRQADKAAERQRQLAAALHPGGGKGRRPKP